MSRIADASMLGSRGPTYGKRQFSDWSRRRSGLLSPTTPPEPNSHTITESTPPQRLCRASVGWANMIELMCRDEFREAEDWLRNGPAPPPEIAAAVLARVPDDLRQRAGDDGW